ncbi:hypothetical protein ACJMK2_022003, partial [Sinanodonta woodiana]
HNTKAIIKYIFAQKFHWNIDCNNYPHWHKYNSVFYSVNFRHHSYRNSFNHKDFHINHEDNNIHSFN